MQSAAVSSSMSYPLKRQKPCILFSMYSAASCSSRRLLWVFAAATLNRCSVRENSQPLLNDLVFSASCQGARDRTHSRKSLRRAR